LWRALYKEGIWFPQPGWLRFVVQIAVAGGVMGLMLSQFVEPTVAWMETDTWTRCVRLALIVAGGATTYFVALFVVGLRLTSFRMVRS
jgi:putative peptidoglycan lipid II flippase